MKRISIGFTLLLLSLYVPFAQDITKGSVIASSREDLLTKLPVDVAYLMPDFTHSQIFYKNGSRFEALLNICIVDNSVRYINEKGDTLLMANAATVSKILSGTALYQQINEVFLHQLVAYGQTSLSVKKTFSFKEPEINIGFTNIAPTSTARSYNPDHDELARNYGKDIEIDYSVEIDYVFTHKDKVYPCKQSTFIKFFPDKKQEIKQFVKDNNIDFSNKDHILSLFYICTEK